MSIGIYLHIPFCHHKCKYCDFLSFEHQGDVPDQYVDALIREWELRKDQVKEDVHSIYFGGGTPSLLSGDQVERILRAIKENSNVLENAEITLEMNPESYREDDVKQYMTAGVNRFSVGLQSTFNDVLQVVGRLHSVERFLEVYHALRNLGVKNLSVDLMFNLPGLSLAMLRESLASVVALEPEHISTYSLKVEEGTPLETLVDQGLVTIGEEDDDRDQHDLARDYLLAHGYEHYEISNFAKDGFASRHNLTYWRNEDYLSLGLGAHGKINKQRYYNVRSLNGYYQELAQGRLPSENVDHLTAWEIDFERVMLGIRISEGVNVSLIALKYPGFNEVCSALVAQGLLESIDQNIRLTERGRNLENVVSYEFYDLMEA